jgi:ribosomal protein S18 acetylase RimI-like enzyme
VFTYIEAPHRRKGAGSELVRAIELDLKGEGIQKVYTKVNVANTAAACFWISQGYQFESRLLRLNQGFDYYWLGKEI